MNFGKKSEIKFWRLGNKIYFQFVHANCGLGCDIFPTNVVSLDLPIKTPLKLSFDFVKYNELQRFSFNILDMSQSYAVTQQDAIGSVLYD